MILREKYRSDPEEIKNEELLFLARLNFLLKIQTLNNKKTRFRQVKNDLPMMISNFENRLNLATLTKETVAVSNADINIEIDSHLTYDNLPSDLTDFFYEEVNLDE